VKRKARDGKIYGKGKARKNGIVENDRNQMKNDRNQKKIGREGTV
jgi:hypothetical protein